MCIGLDFWGRGFLGDKDVYVEMRWVGISLVNGESIFDRGSSLCKGFKKRNIRVS